MARLPDRFKIRNGEQKWLLRQVVYKYLPREMMERPKKGFSIPLGRWLKGELKPYLDYHLSSAQLEKVGVLSPSEVERLKKGFEEGKPENPSKLWFMLIFQMWAERWL
jgi:asparagine synthase (glutamine-hydrolysing)